MISIQQIYLCVSALSISFACSATLPAMRVFRRNVQTAFEKKIVAKSQPTGYTCRDLVALCAIAAQDITHAASPEMERFNQLLSLYWRNGGGKDCIENATYWLGSIAYHKELEHLQGTSAISALEHLKGAIELNINN